MSLIYYFKGSPFVGFFLFSFNILSSSNINPIHISTIEISGNSKTQDFIIKREIRHLINTKLDSNVVNEDIIRLENLGIFSEVNWSIDSLDDRTNKLVYEIAESIQKTPPVAFPFYDENTGWSVQGLWLMNNFRGRNQAISVIGSIGSKNTYGFNFTDPWIFGDHISFNLNLQKTAYLHRYLINEISLNSFKFGMGKWFGYKIKTLAEFEVINKKFSNLNTKHLEEFNYVSPNINIKYDTRDIYWSPSKGLFIKQNFNFKKGFGSDESDFFLWQQSYSYYFSPIETSKKLVLGFNMTINRKYGDKNEYWVEYLGGPSTIRGWSLPDSNIYKSKKFRFGHEFYYTSFELRYDIIPKYVNSLQIESGLAIIFFIDGGSVDYSWEMLQNTTPIYGSGVGIRIPFPMIGVIRIDYGWGYRDKLWNSGAFHFSFGQKF